MGTDSVKNTSSVNEMRRRAEERLKTKASETGSSRTDDDETWRLLHELYIMLCLFLTEGYHTWSPFMMRNNYFLELPIAFSMISLGRDAAFNNAFRAVEPASLPIASAA